MHPSDRIPDREITPPDVYLNRRNFMKAGIVAATTVTTGAVYRTLNQPGAVQVKTTKLAGVVQSAGTDPAVPVAPADPLTSFQKITNYNNFYEFTTSKEAVARMSQNFVARPWMVMVDGLVAKPTLFDLDQILAISPPEERVYRMRCVEAWSMVVPWNGYSLSKLLNKVEPLSTAKYVAFQTLYDLDRFPGQRVNVLNWPYVEGLRLDEAMHPLTLLASGIYGNEMPAPNGAPLRLVIPWKYGFKGIKSIVKITLTDKQPPTSWNKSAPHEYGFYSNVNPEVAHPRWSQATEQRLGESGRRKTLMFNGYADQVAHLYAGMDLRANF
ncbi:MAG: protein-methionine-sulfoxide reductase catalytic subunit MsrP [Planctomycetaceae bacterium]|nr:protein-methionine-sulfoxide reductase catalytic subunit MsrP [Planctomycetaceae bacterium]